MGKKLITGNINMIWASIIIDELVKNGIDTFFISPGNRNAPLISALTYNDEAVKKISIDERSAAYRALGYAKYSGKPGVLVCTSGTALSNYFPAVIEAYRDELPVIILSADRPTELSGSDANQTINQENIFGRYSLGNLNLPAPCVNFPLKALAAKIDNIINIKTGPVHINCRFRDPLIPIVDEKNVIPDEYIKDAEFIINRKGPHTVYIETKSEIINSNDINNIIKNSERGLLVIGRIHPHVNKDNIIKFLKTLNWPVFSDIGSSIKHNLEEGNIFSLDHPESVRLINSYNPDTILHLGSGLVSKQFYEKIVNIKDINYIMVNPGTDLRDPAHSIKYKVISDLDNFIKTVKPESNNLSLKEKTALCESFQKLARSLDGVTQDDQLSFPIIANMVNKKIPAGSALFLGNSITVRAFDNSPVYNIKNIDVVVNRGVSGIEGNIATAAGFAENSGKPLTLVMGDISLIHDLNSLIYLKDITTQVIIILINNNGGRIFERLPIKEFPKILFPGIIAPHGMNFEYIARQFSVPYYHVKTPGDLEKIYENALQKNEHSFIEVLLDPERDLEIFNRRKAVKI